MRFLVYFHNFRNNWGILFKPGNSIKSSASCSQFVYAASFKKPGCLTHFAACLAISDFAKRIASLDFALNLAFLDFIQVFIASDLMNRRQTNMSQCCITSAVTWSPKLVCVWLAQILPRFRKAKTRRISNIINMTFSTEIVQ